MTFPKQFFNDVAAPIILICRFCRAMLCISAAYAVMRCLSVCSCVCHVRGLCRNG